jgi:hypothetical protein
MQKTAILRPLLVGVQHTQTKRSSNQKTRHELTCAVSQIKKATRCGQKRGGARSSIDNCY